MMNMRYIYGPVPSRRLGLSLGVSPIPKKTCNYSCIYCQLGRTDHLTNKREMFFPVKDIMCDFENAISNKLDFDAVTIVGEGEPALYLGLGELIDELKGMTDKPVAVITNGSLLYDPAVRFELDKADIVLPSMDAYDSDSFREINRPYGKLDFDEVHKGLEVFSKEYPGQLWLEIMLMGDINDDDESLGKYAKLLKDIEYERLYLNTPVRPPAESYVKTIDSRKMKQAEKLLGGISIDLLASHGFHSETKDHLEAIISIIQRHPMNQFEINWFLESRGCIDTAGIFKDLDEDGMVEKINYKGYDTYRLLPG